MLTSPQMGMETGGKKVYEQRVIERVEAEKAIAKIKCGKATFFFFLRLFAYSARRLN